ncbi:MAG: hypothetical protein P8M11_14130, partial [Planctomycetota bacterium]|nr:hypothetical protein [Planctomycetota bacterium]
MSIRSQVRALLPASLKGRLRHVLDVIDTEWHHLFHRRSIRQRLAELRVLPRGLHVEGTNTCNAKCVFC